MSETEKQARQILAEARKTAHEELERARHKAHEIELDAGRESARTLREARAAADAVLAEAQALSEKLRAAGEALGAEADQLLRDVRLTHRELLSELRLPGLSERPQERDEAAAEGRILGEPPRQRPAPSEVFELPDWVAGDG